MAGRIKRILSSLRKLTRFDNTDIPVIDYFELKKNPAGNIQKQIKS
jgi:hypothetical protein